MLSIRKFFLCLFVILITLPISGCPQRQSENAGREFVLNTSRIANYTNDALHIVDGLVQNKFLSPDAATNLTIRIRAVNKVNSDLLTEAQKYLVTAMDRDGRLVQRLQFTDGGKIRLAALSVSLREVSIRLINDPVFNAGDSEVRARLTFLTAGLQLAVQQIYNLIHSIRPAPTRALPMTQPQPDRWEDFLHRKKLNQAAFGVIDNR